MTKSPPPMCANLLPPFPTQRALELWRLGGPCPPANYCSNLACTLVAFLEAEDAADADIVARTPKLYYCADCLEKLKTGLHGDTALAALRVFPI